MSMKKWGASHTEKKNLTKSLPGHLRGDKIVEKAIKELLRMHYIIQSKKTGEWHVSLNPKKKEDIYHFLGIARNKRGKMNL